MWTVKAANLFGDCTHSALPTEPQALIQEKQVQSLSISLTK